MTHSSSRCILVAGAVASLLGSCNSEPSMTMSSRAGLEHQLGIVPEAGVQSRLQRAADAGMADGSDAEATFAAIGELHDLTARGKQFLDQLLYFYCRNDRADSVAEQRQLSAVLLLERAGVQKKSIAETVSPYLYDDDERLRSIARRFLAFVEGHSAVRTCGLRDYSEYQSLIDPAGSVDPLVRYMYEQSPASALRALNEIDGLLSAQRKLDQYRRILWAEHVVSNNLWKQQHQFIGEDQVESAAAVELQKLSKHDAWWARLYVAEILANIPSSRLTNSSSG